MPSGTRTLIVFHTSEGQTAKIAERIAETLRGEGSKVDVQAAEHAPAPDAYETVVVGDSIHVVRHSKELTRYVTEHVEALNAMPSALFQVSMASTNPDDEHTTAARALVDKLLKRTSFAPDLVAMFAGALAYSKYGWFTRRIMRWIVRREGGDTDMSRDYEYTNWDEVDRFAHDVLAISPKADPR